MKYYFLVIISFLVGCNNVQESRISQDFQSKVDSIRESNELPGLAVAVFSSDTIYTITYSGHKKLGSMDLLSNASRFHLGSNTKAFIGFAAATMVEDGLIQWDSKYFDICPENKEFVKPEYYDITLDQLLRHRAGLISKDIEFSALMFPNMENDSIIFRDSLIIWALNFDKSDQGFQYSNTGYVMAAQMLEKVSGISWQEIINERIFEPLSIQGYFSWPAKRDTNQTWGHYTDPASGKYIPHEPEDRYYLSRLSLDPAGDINISAKEYIKFLQDNLKGYQGTGGILSPASYQMIHNDPEYGLGWRNTETVYKASNVSVHSGSAGTFFCQSLLFKDDNLGMIIFTNCLPVSPQQIIQTLTNNILDEYLE